MPVFFPSQMMWGMDGLTMENLIDDICLTSPSMVSAESSRELFFHSISLIHRTTLQFPVRLVLEGLSEEITFYLLPGKSRWCSNSPSISGLSRELTLHSHSGATTQRHKGNFSNHSQILLKQIKDK